MFIYHSFIFCMMLLSTLFLSLIFSSLYLLMLGISLNYFVEHRYLYSSSYFYHSSFTIHVCFIFSSVCTTNQLSTFLAYSMKYILGYILLLRIYIIPYISLCSSLFSKRLIFDLLNIITNCSTIGSIK